MITMKKKSIIKMCIYDFYGIIDFIIISIIISNGLIFMIS